MVFSSLTFIFVFLPLFLLAYYTISSHARNGVLFIGSLVFYTAGVLKQPFYLLLFLLMIVVNYSIGRFLSSEQDPATKKTLLIGGLFFDFMWLFLFKYFDFFCSCITDLLGLVLSDPVIPEVHLKLVLPLGISFYTFQMVSYLVDVYRGEVPAEESFLDFGAYVSMFPQLIAGPIVTYSSIRESLHAKRPYSLEAQSSGLKDFIYGLGLKVILANQFGNLWSNVQAIGYDSISTPLAWLGIFAYSFQIYFDFYGYSLMAIGLGKLLGFQLPVNFRHPYVAISMTDFWRRWHITLGQWFRNYVYIPLGGNHTSRGKWIRNIFIVWFLTGIWHGAGWNFILWGILLFLILLIEKLGFVRILEKHPAIGHLYMFFLIPLSWMVFGITNIQDIGVYLTRLFPFLGSNSQIIYHGDFFKFLKDFRFIIPAGFLFSTMLPTHILHRIRDTVAESVICLFIFWLAIYCLHIGLNDPFLYFRF